MHQQYNYLKRVSELKSWIKLQSLLNNRYLVEVNQQVLLNRKFKPLVVEAESQLASSLSLHYLEVFNLSSSSSSHNNSLHHSLAKQPNLVKKQVY
jgi:hypothetical protein